MSVRLRLDEALVARGFYASRARARDAILRGTVWVNGEVATKPSQPVGPNTEVAVSDAAQHYVSRAALKLKHALAHFGIAVEGRHGLDIGASTGGFTQVLLEQGVAHITAIDVGHCQMAVADPRLTLIEGLNARDLARRHLAHPVELIVCDVSFISLKLALPPALDLAEPGADLVALIKPQFEAGRDALGKGGVVADPAVHAAVCRDIAAFIGQRGWSVAGIAPSPIEGSDGNREFLIAARKTGAPACPAGE